MSMECSEIVQKGDKHVSQCWSHVTCENVYLILYIHFLYRCFYNSTLEQNSLLKVVNEIFSFGLCFQCSFHLFGLVH